MSDVLSLLNVVWQIKKKVPKRFPVPINLQEKILTLLNTIDFSIYRRTSLHTELSN